MAIGASREVEDDNGVGAAIYLLVISVLAIVFHILMIIFRILYLTAVVKKMFQLYAIVVSNMPAHIRIAMCIAKI